MGEVLAESIKSLPEASDLDLNHLMDLIYPESPRLYKPPFKAGDGLPVIEAMVKRKVSSAPRTSVHAAAPGKASADSGGSPGQ